MSAFAVYDPAVDLTKLKEAFAVAYARNPNDAYAAARSIEAHPGKAAWIAGEWPRDPEVLALVSQIKIDGGAAALVPDKVTFAHEVLEEARDITDKDTKLKYFDLFAKVMGYIEKPGEARGGNINIRANKVMVVPMMASAEAWEAAATRQQANLIDHAG